MVDGALLLVDAVEGPMPQTRFVLRKALALGLRVIVVINKVDRPHARPAEALNETFDLFVELGASDMQADFPVVYAVGLDGRAGYDADDSDRRPGAAVRDHRQAKCPPPQSRSRCAAAPAGHDSGIRQLQRADRYWPLAIWGAAPGHAGGAHHPAGRAAHRAGWNTCLPSITWPGQEVDEVRAGDILAFAGFENINISDTIADPDVDRAPAAHQRGRAHRPHDLRRQYLALCRARRQHRLGHFPPPARTPLQETRSNVALRVRDGETADRFIVSGRGELHLGILIENMRREGYEFDVSKPEVIFREDPETGETLEPIEEVHIEVADELAGTVFELMGETAWRRCSICTATAARPTSSYLIPTRLLIGFQSQFMRATSGMGQMHSLFAGYEPILPHATPQRQFGSLIADQHWYEHGLCAGQCPAARRIFHPARHGSLRGHGRRASTSAAAIWRSTSPKPSI